MQALHVAPTRTERGFPICPFQQRIVLYGTRGCPDHFDWAARPLWCIGVPGKKAQASESGVCVCMWGAAGQRQREIDSANVRQIAMIVGKARFTQTVAQ